MQGYRSASAATAHAVALVTMRRAVCGTLVVRRVGGSM
jgi:hypothetical protein